MRTGKSKLIKKYVNVIATLLSSEISFSDSKEDSGIIVHIDAPDAPNKTKIIVDKHTLIIGDFKKDDKIRILGCFIAYAGNGEIIPAIIADSDFEDIFENDYSTAESFRKFDKFTKEVVLNRRNSKRPNTDKAGKRVHLNTKDAAKAFYSLTKKSFTPNQQSYIEDWLSHYHTKDNAKKLEIMLGITNGCEESNTAISLKEVEEALNKRFTGLEQPKREFLNHLASMKYTHSSGTVICLVGPAGTGKTEFVRTVGEALNKPFVFIPCSGLTSALDIVGDRQVYNDSNVGKLVESLYMAGTEDCIILLDEFDKMPGMETAKMNKDGNPYNAFLQVFSEREITDTHLGGAEIVCKNTLFVCTCNSLDNIPAFIKNRFDSIISIPAYTDDELVRIAENHTIPSMDAKYNLDPGTLSFTEEAVREVLRYIDDFGARRTEHHIESIYKSIIFEWSRSGQEESATQITPEKVDEILNMHVNMNDIRVAFRQHMKDYSREVVEKVISIEEQLDRPIDNSVEKQQLMRQLELFVRLRPVYSPFTFDPETFYAEANEKLYGMEKEKHLMASLFHELTVNSVESNKRILIVGPQGVGKTALIKAAADAAGLQYVLVRLNGAQHPGYIRGFSRAFQNSDAGIIVRETSKASSLRVLIHLDELDKVANQETQSVLLSLLDDSGLFTDDYLDGVPIDFRSAVFVATSNDYNISPALLSRFTVIEIGSYTKAEQANILRNYLIPCACKGYVTDIQVSKEAEKAFMNYVVSGGVRDLKEKTNRVIRETVYKRRFDESVCVEAEDVYNVLGPIPAERGNRPFDHDLSGLANGLAVTGTGAGMCFAVESRVLSGTGVEITGLPSETVIDSVKLALGVLSSDYDMDFTNKKIHIHFAEGAVKKDGPSAGTSILMSIYSAMVDIPIPKKAAYTGEIDLFGYVWNVGGIIEKVEAADRAGLDTAYIPEQSFEQLSEEEKRKLEEMSIEIVPVRKVSEIIDSVYSK